ncbi:hypothetical protein [Streptosporangium sp. NBC_01469]|uniref:hypothetical protein n=1 Tax=Streptosporangium sp. NBC_01469 TaxID=2903898 RepID=UPI002E28F30B|nr:hypothetical protein [Streptosporangium sp. NBC_01469]
MSSRPPLSSRVRRVCVLLAALVLPVLGLQVITPPAAHAAFPGVNGKIYITDQATEPDKEIYSINPDGTGLTKVIDNADDDGNAVVNATNTKIAFTRFTDTQHLWTMNVDGTGEVQISTEGIIDSRIDWSPDGTRIVYSTLGGLKVIDADGTGATALGVSGSFPAWSPDGTKIAYGSNRNLYTVNLDGTGVTQLTNVPSGSDAFGPDWSPDGAKIAFGLGPIMGGGEQIHTINADGSGLTNISNDAVSADTPQWSPDGTKIAYNSNQNIYTMNADGTGKTLLSGVAGFQFATDWAPAGAPPGADLHVTAVDSADPVASGTPFAYTVTVANNGPANATGVSLATTLSGAARTITSATPSQGSCAIAAPTITCTLGNLAGAADATVTINVTSTATGTLTATSTVTGTETDPTPADNSDAENTTVTTPPAADIDVDLDAQPHLGILVPYLRYTLTAHNNGPNAVISATVKATLPPGASATNLPTGCTAAGSTITCTYGAIAHGTSVDKTFRVPLSLLSLGNVTVSATRTTSAPADLNPANDNASASCNAVSIVLVTCP